VYRVWFLSENQQYVSQTVAVKTGYCFEVLSQALAVSALQRGGQRIECPVNKLPKKATCSNHCRWFVATSRIEMGHFGATEEPFAKSEPKLSHLQLLDSTFCASYGMVPLGNPTKAVL